jgi:acyl-CoA hydrolase
MTKSDPSAVLRFLAAPMDITYGDMVQGGKVLEWIDNAGYACAAGWSGHYCVTVYVGDVRFSRPVGTGELVEVEARLVHTGRTSMHILCTVSSADPKTGQFTEATRCLTVFVAVDPGGMPTEVPTWTPPISEAAAELQAGALRSTEVRASIEAEMRQQIYSDAGTAPERTLRFLAVPSDANWGGKVHGGIAMRWIDEAAYVCAVGWNHGRVVAVYAGGVRFYRPILIGSVVEVSARLVHTGEHSMHISVHVRSGDPRTTERELTTHCLLIFVGLDEENHPVSVPVWEPVSDEDVALDRHARKLVELRRHAYLLDRDLPRLAGALGRHGR